MNKELENKIFNDFPELFKHRDDMKASLLCFGFECDDGWYDLIYNLCKDIRNYYIRNYKNVPDYFYVMQIKEKFGSLRFYITSAPERIHDMISITENKSYYICEKCGKEGKYFYRDKLPWIQTLCDSCLDKYIFEHFNRVRDKKEDYISHWQKINKAPFKIIKSKR
jgi:hypothetical protein